MNTHIVAMLLLKKEPSYFIPEFPVIFLILDSHQALKAWASLTLGGAWEGPVQGETKTDAVTEAKGSKGMAFGGKPNQSL